jgi:nucleotide-binding universal stress UspA family protein
VNAAIAQRIVVGYDGSEAAERALDRAAGLAGYGTTVTVVSVAPSEPDEVERAHRLLEEARTRLTARHVSVRTLDPIGEPVRQIVAAATDIGADLVVVGGHNGHAVEAPLALGSTSTGVLHGAPCDVLVVR